MSAHHDNNNQLNESLLPASNGVAHYGGVNEVDTLPASAINGRVEYEDDSSQYTVYASRLYILFVFSLLSSNQSCFWLTFSPIQATTEKYYNIDDFQVDLLLNWGPIIFIPALPFTFYLCDLRGGLRKVVLCSSTLCSVAMIVRCIPSIIPDLFPYSLYFIHTAQIMNAAAGPLVMSTVSQVSFVWFGVNERTKATAVAAFSNYVGSAIGFLLMPAIVTEPDNMPYLFYCHAGMAIFASICTLAYFPEYPPTPPSRAAELITDSTAPQPTVYESTTLVYRHFLASLLSPSVAALAISGGLLNGVFGSWTALFSTIIPVAISDVTAGWFSFATTIASVVGGVLAGVVADLKPFRRRQKMLLIISMILTTGAFIWFLLSIDTPVFPVAPLPYSVISLGIALTVCGFMLGLSLPLCFELAAEICFPIPEAYSAGLITLWNNIGSLVFVFCQPLLSGGAMNVIMFGNVILALLLTLPVQEQYLRRAEDERVKTINFVDTSDPLSNGHADNIAVTKQQVQTENHSTF